MAAGQGDGTGDVERDRVPRRGIGDGLALRRGDLSQALGYYQGALDAARSSGDRALEGTLLNNLGNMHLHLGLYDEAGIHYEQALEIRREIGAHAKEISGLSNLGLVHHYQGDQEMARSRFHQALALAEAMGDRRAGPSPGWAWGMRSWVWRS